MEPDGTIESRLYLGDISDKCSADEIRELLEKLKLSVLEVYLSNKPTITGLRRCFAITRVKCSAKDQQHCLKALHNSFWKGGKIKVELAKEFYLDRLARERLESLVDNQSLNLEPSDVQEHNVFKSFEEDRLFLRPVRGRPGVVISTIPNVSSPDCVMSSCKRYIFEDKDGVLSPLRYINGELLSEESDICKQKVKQIPATGKQAKIGAGIRRGFGTLLENTCQSCVSNSNTVDGLESFEAMDVENVPCMQPEDLTDGALTSERERYSQMLGRLFSATASSKVQPPPSSLQSTYEVNKEYNQFANILELKSIFHKEGGVLWESDAEVRGRIVEDRPDIDDIFLEAERSGFDVRSSDGASKHGIGLAFGFFSEPETIGNSSSTQQIASNDIVDKALLFRSKRTKTAIANDWSIMRDKFRTDFKRKRREALKNSRNNRRRK